MMVWFLTTRRPLITIAAGDAAGASATLRVLLAGPGTGSPRRLTRHGAAAVVGHCGNPGQQTAKVQPRFSTTDGL